MLEQSSVEVIKRFDTESTRAAESESNIVCIFGLQTEFYSTHERQIKTETASVLQKCSVPWTNEQT